MGNEVGEVGAGIRQGVCNEEKHGRRGRAEDRIGSRSCTLVVYDLEGA